VQGFNLQFKSGLNRLSLSHESNKEINTEKNKNRCAIKSGNGHKNQWDRSHSARPERRGEGDS